MECRDGQTARMIQRHRHAVKQRVGSEIIEALQVPIFCDQQTQPIKPEQEMKITP